MAVDGTVLQGQSDLGSDPLSYYRLIADDGSIHVIPMSPGLPQENRRARVAKQRKLAGKT